ncbi:hypothetical protein [Candidatus Cyanaurora vandensis]|uniref:hypothetical protein n=1 Tax=Candidatus Cyanaurora vandensis TaxID=2714958 RepID=UPI00257B4E52|nr:hypothetical protein [Candidatus Cyanaurora vandensis]
MNPNHPDQPSLYSATRDRAQPPLLQRDIAAAVFPDQAQAQAAYDQLRNLSFERTQVGIAMADPTAQGNFIARTGGRGTVVSGANDAGAGLVDGLARSFDGDRLKTDSLLDVLVNAGYDEGEVAMFRASLNAGGVLLTISNPGSRHKEALDILEHLGGTTLRNHPRS